MLVEGIETRSYGGWRKQLWSLFLIIISNCLGLLVEKGIFLLLGLQTFVFKQNREKGKEDTSQKIDDIKG